jgi:hypothetical protein
LGSTERKTRSIRRRICPATPSLEVDASGSIVCKPIRGSLGSPRHRVHSLFPNPDVDFSRSAVCSPSVMTASSSFRDASPLQSSFARSPRSGPFGRRPSSSMVPELHLLGFRSLFATSHARSHFSPDFPSPATFRPQAFASSRRFALRPRLRACFIPLPRPGFNLFKGFSPCASHPSSSEGACPLAVASSSLHAPASTFAETNALPRAMPLGFEALIWARPRSTSPVIHLARSRSLLQFRLLQVPFFALDVGSVFLGAFRSWCCQRRSSIVLRTPCDTRA